MLKSSQSLY